MDFVQNMGNSAMGPRGCCKHSKGKLCTCNWLCDIPEAEHATDYVEVQFKNTRKGYYLNEAKIPLNKGDIVAVEANPGHDIGTVTLTGKLVLLQMRKNNVRQDNTTAKKIYRIAKPGDLERYEEAKAKEHETMIRSRQIAADLGLSMKIGDVEYQGDGNKAIFYYIAEGRVDFRQLIKVLAENFHVRIEMKQIGARQEAGRIGGIGPCGRQLCCSSWMTNFVSVATDAARLQDISMNPQKLAGQCAKLKCCINYEVDAYAEVQKQLPSRKIALETKDRTYYHFKTDIFKKELSYSTDKVIAANIVTISAERVFEIINLNRKGLKPDTLEPEHLAGANTKPIDTHDILDDSVSRFDSVRKKKKKRPSGNSSRNNTNANAEQAAANNKPQNGNQRTQPQAGNRTEPKNGNAPRRKGGGRGNPSRNNGHTTPPPKKNEGNASKNDRSASERKPSPKTSSDE